MAYDTPQITLDLDAEVYRDTMQEFSQMQTWRNTFAAQQLNEHGRTKHDVKGYLGLALERSAEIYETAKPRKKGTR